MDRINLNTINQLPDDLREILAQAPAKWAIGALHDYLDRNVSIDEIRRDWESRIRTDWVEWKAAQDAQRKDV